MNFREYIREEERLNAIYESFQRAADERKLRVPPDDKDDMED